MKAYRQDGFVIVEVGSGEKEREIMRFGERSETKVNSLRTFFGKQVDELMEAEEGTVVVLHPIV